MKGACIDSSCSLIYCCILSLGDEKEEAERRAPQTRRHRFKRERKESRERAQQNSIIVNVKGQVMAARLFVHLLPNLFLLYGQILIQFTATKRNGFFYQEKLQVQVSNTGTVQLKFLSTGS